MKIAAKKLGMTQIWKNGAVVPVTVLGVSEGQEEILGQIVEGSPASVVSKSKGKGFQGVVKRHGFHGGPQSHGQKDRLRAPGSIGSTAPQRVLKGRKMAGRTGGRRTTVKNLSVTQVDTENKKIFIRGAVPGMRGTPVEINI